MSDDPITSARSMGANRWQVFRWVVFPHMVPSFFAGMRLAMTNVLLGVLVAMKSSGDKEKLTALGKQIAMHIAAAAPLALTAEHLSKEVIDRERAIHADIARQSGTAEQVIDKKIEGRMRKFYEESVLMSQVFVFDQETPVAKVVEKASKEFGTPVAIEGFVRFQVGEGIEKVESDFADEVSKMAGN